MGGRRELECVLSLDGDNPGHIRPDARAVDVHHDRVSDGRSRRRGATP
jgi:hypothetical protein